MRVKDFAIAKNAPAFPVGVNAFVRHSTPSYASSSLDFCVDA
jgi:hypothetical protein